MYRTGREPSRQQTLFWLRWLSQKLEAESKDKFLIEKMQPDLLKASQQKWMYRISVVLLTGLVG